MSSEYRLKLRRALHLANDAGISGSIAVGAVAGMLTAIGIRFQALRADLPAWRDL